MSCLKFPVSYYIVTLLLSQSVDMQTTPNPTHHQYFVFPRPFARDRGDDLRFLIGSGLREKVGG